MYLPEPDIALLHKLHPLVLVYVNRRLKLVADVDGLHGFASLPPAERWQIRDALCEHTELLGDFAGENPNGLSPDELAVVRSWRHLVHGTFYILRYLKNYTVFLNSGTPSKAYGVCALTDSFEMLCPRPPVMVHAVLLPFRERIVYDGILRFYRITFGGGIRRSLTRSYNEAKARFGIITSLPFDPEGVARSDLDQLKFYLRSRASREEYWDEIEDLIESDHELLVFYHQHTGKGHARRLRKRLRELGVRPAWFAALEGQMVASGKTKRDLERTLRDILPPEELELVCRFQLKAPRDA